MCYADGSVYSSREKLQLAVSCQVVQSHGNFCSSWTHMALASPYMYSRWYRLYMQRRLHIQLMVTCTAKGYLVYVQLNPLL